MKSRIMLKLILILLSVLGCSLATAQNEYIVLIKGDTLYGKVKYLDFGPEKKVQLSEGKKKTTYSTLQVRSFFMDNEAYHLVRIYNTYTFMKPLTPDGYLMMYSFRPDDQVQWDGRFLAKKDGTGMEIPNIGFKKKLADFITECRELSDEVASGDLGRNDIPEIVNRYNQCVEYGPGTAATPPKPSTSPALQNDDWNNLETGIRNSQKIDDKETVLEMVDEVKAKVARNENIPKFLLDGLNKLLEPEPSLQQLLNKTLGNRN